MRRHDLAHLEMTAGNLPLTYTVKIPVLFLRGTADSTSPEAAIGLIKKLLPQTKVINYEGAGHWLMYQEKENIVKDVLTWLSESNLTSKP
jgi:pimeloyl-ACP methyl ester carboxylesterase